MTKVYRIEELGTMGWELVADDAVKLTKDEAKARLDKVIAEGINPNRLRAIPDV